jgi:5-methylcytosine-specific restriction endonuclease McrA
VSAAQGKTCKRCGAHHAEVAGGFYLRRRANKRPYYEQPCKACRRADARTYAHSPRGAETRAARLAREAAERAALRPAPLTLEQRRERARERARQRRLADPEGTRARMRRHMEQNRERIYARNREASKRNRWVFRAAKARRRAAVRECEMPVRPRDLRRLVVLQDGRCFWCDGALGLSPHVDHIIPLARGGTGDVWNVALSCPTCNVRKQAQLPLDWAPRRWLEVTAT